MQSSSLTCLLLVAALCPFGSLQAQDQSTDVVARYAALVNSTTMTLEGKSPFHIKLDVQLADLRGVPSTSGTVEEWWISPRQYRIEYIAGNLHKTSASGVQDNTPTELHRELYLLSKALSLWTQPLHTLREKEVVKSEVRKMGKYSFDCLLVATAPVTADSPFVCADKGQLDLRVSSQSPEFIVRESVGVFQGTQVPRSTTLRYDSRLAFTAKLTALQRLETSAAESLKLVLAPTASSESSHVGAGTLVSKVQPDYPTMARQQHLSGTVVLEALISKQGTVAQLIPIASPDVLLTDAALNAVRKWTYTPYVLEGIPTEVDTTITVNFNISIAR